MDVTYRFNGFTVDPVRRLLFGADDQPIPLKPRVFDTLLYLIEHRGELLDKQRLLDAVWPHVVVEENNLNQAISTLRRTLGETRDDHRFIVTEPGRGYRFVAQLETVARAVPPAPAAPPAPAPAREAKLALPPIGKAVLAGAAILLSAIAVFAAIDAYRSGERAQADSGASSRPPVTGQSVAVLPFADLSESGDRAWLADGLTEEILNSLAQLPDLKVTGRTSSFRFRNAQRDVAEIAAALGVAHVLEGAVRLVGDDLRVTAQLVRADDGFHVWSNTYDGSESELLDFQREVAERVASALDVVLDERLRARMFAGGTRNVEAFEAYRLAWQAVGDSLRRGDGGLEAIRHFDRALTLDPRYALAALGKTTVLQNVLLGSSVSPYSQAEALEQMRAAYAFVASNGATPTMRLVAEINLESLSPTWFRMPALLNRLRQEGNFDDVLLGGNGTGWLPVVLAVTRANDLHYTLGAAHVANDPLAIPAWLRRAHAELQSGNFAAAKAVLAEARQVVGREPVFDYLEYFVARREGDRDGVVAFLRTFNDPNAAMFLAAVQGDYETALHLADAAEAKLQGNATAALWWVMDTYYEMGETDRLRATVQRIDAAPQGMAILMQFFAMPGALALDLDDAPNFAAKLAQAGIDPATFARLTRLSATE